MSEELAIAYLKAESQQQSTKTSKEASINGLNLNKVRHSNKAVPPVDEFPLFIHSN
jgi:hypothetical protein